LPNDAKLTQYNGLYCWYAEGMQQSGFLVKVS